MCGPLGCNDRITVPCVAPQSPPRLPCAILQLLRRTLPTLRATSYAISWSHPFFQATALFHPVGQPNNRGVNSLVLSNGLPDPPDPVTLLCFSHIGPPPHVEQSSDRRLEWCPVWQPSTLDWRSVRPASSLDMCTFFVFLCASHVGGVVAQEESKTNCQVNLYLSKRGQFPRSTNKKKVLLKHHLFSTSFPNSSDNSPYTTHNLLSHHIPLHTVAALPGWEKRPNTAHVHERNWFSHGPVASHGAIVRSERCSHPVVLEIQ